MNHRRILSMLFVLMVCGIQQIEATTKKDRENAQGRRLAELICNYNDAYEELLLRPPGGGMPKCLLKRLVLLEEKIRSSRSQSRPYIRG